MLWGRDAAEMPGIVPEDVVELSGFCIGAVEKPDLIDPTTVQNGDVLVGFHSDSFHANGFSLVRRVLASRPGEFSEEEEKAMLAPTRLYHDVVKEIREAGVTPKAYAHITGGGLPENLERLFQGKGADLTIPHWDNAVCQKVLESVDAEDRFHTFNMGIGWVAIVAPEDVDKILSAGPGGVALGAVRDGDGVTVKVG